ncbi:hypothetical protein HMPREF1377_02082 [Enterococcus faecium R494]|nr:hypothetical protein HMPREF1377_02082 [Enterococcus faecium R494]
MVFKNQQNKASLHLFYFLAALKTLLLFFNLYQGGSESILMNLSY